MKLLAVVRLSRDSDDTTSPERQLARVEDYAAVHGHEIVGVAEDLDVSGSVSPFERPSLGSWLTDETNVALWDGLIVSRLDRVSRSSLDFLNLHNWMDQHGKTLIALDAQIDMSTPIGRGFAQVGVIFAQVELENIRARVVDSYRNKQQSGSYPGGTVPFGYRAVRSEDGPGWRFAADPEFAPVLAEMADRLIGGESLRQIAAWLNQAGIPTSRNVQRIRGGKPVAEANRWTSFTVRKVLRNPAAAGITASRGQPLRGADGLPVKRCEGVITWAKWRQLRDLLTASSDRSGPRINSSPLLGIVFCVLCDAPMYQKKSTVNGRQYRYYQCSMMHTDRSRCQAKMTNAETVESIIEGALLEELGDLRMLERHDEPGEDHADELEQVEEAITQAETDRYVHGLFGGEDGTRRYVSMMSSLEGRMAKLRSLPSAPARTVWIETEFTLGGTWAGLDQGGRNRLLRRMGVSALCFSAKGQPDRVLPVPTVRQDGTVAGTNYDITRNGVEVILRLGDLERLRESVSKAL